jgi:hypothetical protein
VKNIYEKASRPKIPTYSNLCTYSYGTVLVLSVILVFLLSLGSKTRIFGEAPPNVKSELKIGIVTDPHHVDPDPAFPSDADPDPAFLVDTDRDPDLALHFEAETDPIRCRSGSS